MQNTRNENKNTEQIGVLAIVKSRYIRLQKVINKKNQREKYKQKGVNLPLWTCSYWLRDKLHFRDDSSFIEAPFLFTPL